MNIHMFYSNKWNAELKGRDGGRGAKIGMRVTWAAGSRKKNPLPGREIARAQGIWAHGLVVGGVTIFFARALFFGYFFLSQQKKVTPPGGMNYCFF